MDAEDIIVLSPQVEMQDEEWVPSREDVVFLASVNRLPFDGCAGQPWCHGTLTFGFSITSGPGWASPLTETVDGTSRL